VLDQEVADLFNIT